MEKDICLHAIGGKDVVYSFSKNNKILKQIVRDGALLSRKERGIFTSQGFNGIDYISLCDYNKRCNHPFGLDKYTAYYGYIRSSLSLIFRISLSI